MKKDRIEKDFYGDLWINPNGNLVLLW